MFWLQYVSWLWFVQYHALFSSMHQHSAWGGSSNQGIERTGEVKINYILNSLFGSLGVLLQSCFTKIRHHQDWTVWVIFYMLFQTTMNHPPKVTFTRCMNFSPGFVDVVHQYKGFNNQIGMMWWSRIYRIVLPNDLPLNLWVVTQRFEKIGVFSCLFPAFFFGFVCVCFLLLQLRKIELCEQKLGKSLSCGSLICLDLVVFWFPWFFGPF